ncbi:MAG: hypothetical protein IAE89_16615 [Anaerolineae bacterium]|nr:hypothetical protein [Anaerolineae bacterium]
MTNKPSKPNPPVSRTLLLGALLIAIIALAMMALINLQQNPSAFEPPATVISTPDGE